MTALSNESLATARLLPRRVSSWLLGLVAAAWLVLVIVTAWHHEFWRDEVRALSIAIAAPSLWDLPALLRDEGHPVLWYGLLHVAYAVTHSVLVLPVLAALIACVAVLLFLWRAPFSLPLKVFFVFSILPLYEYAVMARNYGISMLLMFAFATLYPSRRRHPLALAALLAALANTNVHSLLLAGILMALWLWDDAVVDRRSLTARAWRSLLLGAGLVAAAAVLATLTVLPDNMTSVTAVARPRPLEVLIRVLTHPWESMDLVLPPRWGVVPGSPEHVFKDLLIVGLFLGLWARMRLAIAWAAAVIGFGLIFKLIYGGAVRHQGLLLIFALVLYWLRVDERDRDVGTRRDRPLVIAVHVLLPLILLWGDYMAFESVSTDLRYEVSSVKAFAAWLDGRPQYRNAIIISEPDHLLEALPYYSSVDLFMTREGRFGAWSRFTTASAGALTLAQLLDTAERLKSEQARPVLIALGLRATDFERSASQTSSFGHLLVWSPAQWQRFRGETTPVASFRNATQSPYFDENFDLYEVR
jgi:hypothetical protein